MNLISEDYLMHYGVKGMKWGVRHDPERSEKRATRKLQKVEKYRSKLVTKAEKRAGEYRKSAREIKNEIDDIKKMGNKSAYWKQHVKEEVDDYTQRSIEKNKKAGYSDKDAEFWGKASGGVKWLELSSDYSSPNHINTYISDLSKSRSNSIRIAKQYTTNKNSLMNYKIDNLTKKRDVRKAYRTGLSFWE